MHEQRADGLQLAVGKPAALLTNGSARPVTRDPLTDAQILGLLREIASGDTAARVGQAAPLTFSYQAPTGQVRV
jgi:hypothetical protein